MESMNSACTLTLAEVQCFVDWLKEMHNDEHCKRVLQVMGQCYLDRIHNANPMPDLEASWIAEQLNIETSNFVSPSNWIKWQYLLKYFERRRGDLITLSRARGLERYLYPKQSKTGTKGEPSTYCLAFIPIPDEIGDTSQLTDEGQNLQHAHRLEPQAEYTKSRSIKLSAFISPFFKNSELKFNNWNIPLLLLFLLACTLISMLFLFLSFVSFANMESAISPKSLSMLIIGFLFPLLVWKTIVWPWVRLGEDRILPASDFYVKFNEKQCQLELMNEGGVRWIQFVRYSAPCPYCGATLYLDDGSPDFPRRMVGRCAESPREHIYSFDRVTCKGYPLRPFPINGKEI